jgi:hypothetical protein
LDLSYKDKTDGKKQSDITIMLSRLIQTMPKRTTILEMYSKNGNDLKVQLSPIAGLSPKA